MKNTKWLVVVLCLGVVLSSFVQNSRAQHLRWGKRDEMNVDDYGDINEGRDWPKTMYETNVAKSQLVHLLKRAYMAGKYSERRRNANREELLRDKKAAM